MKAYPANQTGQITEENDTTSTLEVHEDAGGHTACGIEPRPWRGKRMVFTSQGPGLVTCALCAKKLS